MARWEGNTRGRLENAALELFSEQGYDRTTVAQIAQRANLTERSFYRWYADKREVLFGGSADLEKQLDTAIDAAEDTAALPRLLTAFTSVPDVFRPREFLQLRAEIIAANPPLQERELIKLAAISATLTSALLRHGHDEQTARLATDIGMAILRLATERWLDDEQADFAELLATSAADLLTVAKDSTQVHPRPVDRVDG